MRGIRPEMADHPMAQAAREVNAYAEKHGIAETCEHYNLNVDDVRYISEQRALRALYGHRGINLDLHEPTILNVPNDLMTMLTAAYMDALVIGWRANEIQDSIDHNMKGE